MITLKAIVLASWLASLLFVPLAMAQAAEGWIGHWEGAISLPSTQLGVRVDFEESDNQLAGSIDIPVQGLAGFALGGIETTVDGISFNMPNIPGDPSFAGKLAADGRSIAGDFTQGGRTFPFKLERTEKKAREGEPPSKGVPGDGFAGVWQGSLKVNLFEMRLVLKLKENEGVLSGALDSIDQGANDIPITQAVVDGKKLTLELATVGGGFEGSLNDEGSEIAGDWKQGGQKMPLVFRRIEKAPNLSRPQDPKKPYPYKEEEVVFENPEAQIKLAGTFTFPQSEWPHPAVVLLSGSGPQDRDEAIMGHRPFLVLADHLTRRGIAVLRFDDRGFGESEGKFSAATNTDFVSDALAAVEYLKTRQEVDGTKIGLIGHSEGGITAPRAAVRSEDVAFIVLMAGVGVPMDELLVRQAQDLLRVMGATDEDLAKQADSQLEMFRILREEKLTDEAKMKIRTIAMQTINKYTEDQLKAMGVSKEAVEGQLQMMFSSYFIELLNYDPGTTLQKVQCPVLAINGEKDLQVAARENLAAIEQWVKKGGNDDVTVIEFPDLNHLFQTCETGAIAEYGQIEETFNPEALKVISDWVVLKTKGR